MSKKQPIVIKRDEDLLAIDNELDQAMERLSGVNREVGELLASFDQDAEDGAGPEDTEAADVSSDTATGADENEEKSE